MDTITMCKQPRTKPSVQPTPPKEMRTAWECQDQGSQLGNLAMLFWLMDLVTFGYLIESWSMMGEKVAMARVPPAHHHQAVTLAANAQRYLKRLQQFFPCIHVLSALHASHVNWLNFLTVQDDSWHIRPSRSSSKPSKVISRSTRHPKAA